MNPPAIPLTSNFVAIRSAHIKHEASVKSIGTLYLIGAIFLPIAAIASLFNAQEPVIARTLIFFLLVALAYVELKVGLWLRALDVRGRTPATVLSVIGLLGFPIGTLISGYILYLLQSKKGALIFSNEYKEVIANTPEIKYKTSIVVWIFVGLLLLVIFAAVIGTILSKSA